MPIGIDTPLMRLERDFAARLKELELENADLKTRMATVRGINEMLKIQLLDFQSTIKSQQEALQAIIDNISSLKSSLPEL
jgi:hypothetical protein